MHCTSSAEEDARQEASMPGPAEVFVMFWIFGMFAPAVLAIFAVKRLFERHRKKVEKKDGGNGE
jgi:beta-lactamase regulating signal transducer with metallopeptidase domain